MQPDITPAKSAARQTFYSRIDRHNYSALWNVLANIITPEPKSACVPYMWRFAEAKNYILEAGGLITAAEAERRVLILENPGLRGKSSITTSIYAGIQLVMPGEVAPVHRHSQSAVRFVLDGGGPGAYTAVNGERTTMHYGDFILTPPNHWHDHGNTSAEPVIWLDGLDIPMVSHFDTSFLDHRDEESQPVTKKEGDSSARYGANMLPVDFKPGEMASPIFNYPYTRSREALESMRQQNEWDPCHGLKMRFVNPVDGGFAMPTISAFMQLLPKGFKTAAFRSTDATVFVAVEGRGRTTVDGQTFEWGPKDIIVAPSWKWTSHEVEADSVLFSISDRVAQEKLGLWRQDRGNAEDAR